VTEQVEAGKPSTARTVFRYALSRYYRQFLGLALALLRPRLLPVGAYGLWTGFKIVPRYASYLHLGTRDAMRFVAPYYRATDNGAELRNIKATVLTVSLLVNVAVSCVLAACFLAGGFSLEFRVGLLAMAVLVVVACIVQHIVALLRAEERFELLGKSYYLEATVVFVATIPLLYFWRIYGLYVSLLLTETAVLVYLLRHYRLGPRLHFSWGIFRDLVKQGGPILVSDFMIELISTSDRLLVACLLGKTQLGYYGIAVTAFAALIQIPGAAREILEPLAMKEMDAAASKEFVEKHMLRPLVNAAYLLPFLIGIVYFALPIAVRLLLPRYLPGIAPAQTLAFGVYFLALAYLPRPLIVANHWQLQLGAYLPIALLTNIAVSATLVARGYGLVGIAVGSCVSYCVLLVLLLVFIRRRLLYRHAGWWRSMLALALPIAVLCATVYALEQFGPCFAGNTFARAVVNLIVTSAVLLVLHQVAPRWFPLLRPLVKPGVPKEDHG